MILQDLASNVNKLPEQRITEKPCTSLLNFRAGGVYFSTFIRCFWCLICVHARNQGLSGNERWNACIHILSREYNVLDIHYTYQQFI